MKKSKLTKIDEDFLKEIRDIKIERLKKGKDFKPRSDRRITKGLIRLPEWPKIKNDLINANFMEEFD